MRSSCGSSAQNNYANNELCLMKSWNKRLSYPSCCFSLQLLTGSLGFFFPSVMIWWPSANSKNVVPDHFFCKLSLWSFVFQIFVLVHFFCRICKLLSLVIFLKFLQDVLFGSRFAICCSRSCLYIFSSDHYICKIFTWLFRVFFLFTNFANLVPHYNFFLQILQIVVVRIFVHISSYRSFFADNWGQRFNKLRKSTTIIWSALSQKVEMTKV